MTEEHQPRKTTMHPLLADKIVESVKLRHSQGDCPIEPAQPTETLEFAILELADRPARMMRTLAEATRKFAPDLATQLAERWSDAAKDRDARLDAFLAVLRS